LKDIFLNSLVEAMNTKSYDFRYEFYCRLSDELHIPKAIREQYKAKSLDTIMLVVRSDAFPEPEFDFDRQEFSFYTHFGRVPFTVIIPVKDIFMVIDDYNGIAVQFHYKVEQEPKKSNFVPNSAAMPILVAKPNSSSKPKLVVDNNKKSENPKSKSKAKLKLVVDNTKKE